MLLKWECHEPPLTRTPIQFPTKNKKRATEGHRQPAGEGAIEPIHRSCSLGFFRLFLVPKKTGDLRPVIDLSTLNRHLVVSHFQMETAQTVRAAVCPGQWMISIRHQGWLSPRSDEPICKKNFLSIHVSTIRISNLSQRIHQALVSCGAVTEVTRCPSAHVFRWLVATYHVHHVQLVIRVLQHLGWIINFVRTRTSL